MAKRQTEESRIVAYFTNAPLETARVISGIVAGIMKQRLAGNTQSAIPGIPIRKIRKKRTPKTLPMTTEGVA